MGYLTTFTFDKVNLAGIKASGPELTDLVYYSDMKSRSVKLHGMRATVFPPVHGSETQVYVKHENKLHLLNRGRAGTVMDVAKLQLHNLSLNKSVEQKQPVINLEDAFVAMTIYNDYINDLLSDKVRFGYELAETIQKAASYDSTDFYHLKCFPNTIVHAPLPKGKDAVYITTGNTSLWFDAGSPEAMLLKKNGPKFYKELYSILSQACQ